MLKANQGARALRASQSMHAHATVRPSLCRVEDHVLSSSDPGVAGVMQHVMAHVSAPADRTDPSKMVPDNLSSCARSAPQD